MQVIPLGEQDELADIRKEIGFLAACDHPNIVRYLVRLEISITLFKPEILEAHVI